MKIENLNTPERQAKRDQSRKEGFNTFMNNPMARALISIQPPSEHLEALLQAAFNQGFDCGGGAAAIEIAEALIQRQGQPR